MTGVVLVVVSSLAVLSLLALAISLVAFLFQTSRHRSSRGWALAMGGSLVLVLLFGGISNAVSRHSGITLGEGSSTASSSSGQAHYDARDSKEGGNETPPRAGTNNSACL